MKPVVVLVGGYLGAGKTTLLLRAAGILESRGVRTGLLMNDQGNDLVDSATARQAGREVRDVTGSCFCCALPDVVEQLHALAAAGAQVILGEPVGSCTDIVRTVVQPLQEMTDQWDVAPFTALVDADRAQWMEQTTNSDLAYLYQQQLAEADLLVGSKADLGGTWPVHVGLQVSARTGEGVAEWLDLVLAIDAAAGTHPLDVDYERYGAAEASLAWMNFSARVRCREATPSLQVLGPFFDDVRTELQKARAPVAHVKALAVNSGGALRAGVCGDDDEVALEGAVIGDAVVEHRLLLNLRAECSPETATGALHTALERLRAAGEVEVEREQCFRPSPPRPSVWRVKSIE